ncbi:prolyl oligopeptidase family serine peptidase [Paraburkholderia sp. USG1]|uniref:alpha/beta hydrolase family protein n=1 Tax=Paraburkholderia sp. USG1 TaxID=2952268 RepID=UPI0028615565|nr:prolyl oligopeptidase family serine peptidase [Paraburkholderia sp. USG1]MDR8398025.1 prolyl oligopeptidase family serine peptidase [Paraburkholderia sp. USG1]
MSNPSYSTHDVTLTGDGLTLGARHYAPANGQRAPAVIVCPGGISTGLIDSIDWLASRLAAGGFHTLSVTYRAGSPIDDHRDIKIAFDWLQRQPSVAPDSTAVMGMSRGGTSALRAAAEWPELRAALSFGSPTDLLQHVRGVAGYAPGRYALLCQWLGGAPDEHRAFYEEVQPISHAHKIRQPVLGIHGAFDMHVPVEQTQWMNEALKRHNNPHAETHVIPFMNHYCDVTPTYSFGFDLVTQPAIEFLRRHLSR